MKFHLKDLSGELHTVEAVAVNYVRAEGQKLEAHFLDAEHKVVAVFAGWHWVKPTPVVSATAGKQK